jgi:uncharacterized protein DUF397
LGASATGQRISYDATSDVQMQVHLHMTIGNLRADPRQRRTGIASFKSHMAERDPSWVGVLPQKEIKVDVVPNPLLPAHLRAVKWRKSRHSNPSGNCVEMARLPGGRVAVRDSHRPDGPALLFSRAAWERFLHGVREGATELALAGLEAADCYRPATCVATGDLQRFAVPRR